MTHLVGVQIITSGFVWAAFDCRVEHDFFATD